VLLRTNLSSDRIIPSAGDAQLLFARRSSEPAAERVAAFRRYAGADALLDLSGPPETSLQQNFEGRAMR